MKKLNDADSDLSQPVVVRWFPNDAKFWLTPEIRKAKRVHLQHPKGVDLINSDSWMTLCGHLAMTTKSERKEFLNPSEEMKCKRCLQLLQYLKTS
jgi:hypothetical protein